jgi:hypothetical protein
MPRDTFLRILTAMGAALSLACVASQQPPHQNAALAPHRRPYSPYKEFHVDQKCRLLPDPLVPAPERKKPHLHYDPVICHLETVAHSEHMEETVVGNELQRSWITIREQEYVVQNIATDQAIFVVHQFVPAGWLVDSDPQPSEVDLRDAIFRVYAQPGQIVRLHVGLRHVSPLKTKQIG